MSDGASGVAAAVVQRTQGVRRRKPGFGIRTRPSTRPHDHDVHGDGVAGNAVAGDDGMTVWMGPAVDRQTCAAMNLTAVAAVVVGEHGIVAAAGRD